TGRLYYLQIIRSDDYKTLSENNRIKLNLLAPYRGEIFDRNERTLAVNQNTYKVLLDKQEAKDIKTIIQKIVQILNFSEQEIESINKKIVQQKSLPKLVIYNNLNWDELVQIETNLFDLPGVTIEVGQIRYYPYGANCAHIIGYLASPSENNKEKNLYYHPDIKIGKNGIEKIYDKYLSGQVGFKKMEVNAHGYIVRELSVEEPKNGTKITLSIDAELQNKIVTLVKNKSASVVVIDVNNGNLLALCSTPSFDNNEFNKGISTDYWKELNSNPYLPLINKSISTQYPPGSTFKLIVALAALEDNISSDLEFYCPGYVMLGERKFHCWKEGGHGHLNLIQAIACSCNCYFYNLSTKIGIEKIALIAEKFNLGKKTNIDLPGEVPGFVPNKKWKRQKLKKDWLLGDTLNAAIGQGYVLATPIQLAVMAARIASGKLITPSLILNENVQFHDLPINLKNLNIIRKAMEDVVNQPGGSGYNSRIEEYNKRFAGKTGTSQVISKKSFSDDLNKASTSYVNRNHGSFVCYGPVNNPKYACSVVIEHSGSGGGNAAPIARDVMMELL
ncbi:MAG: penicillin-binding protein 2, partial [Alphaproteobacteria bacterium]